MFNKEISDLMDDLYEMAKLQFGDVVKARWFHKEDACPGCGKKINAMKYKSQSAMSVNTFIYRDRGVLIVYLLCGKCGKQVIKATENLPLHAEIEKNLKSSYLRYSGN